MIGDMSLLDEAYKDIEKLEKELATLNSQIPKSQITMTLEEAQLEKSTIGAELKNERTQIDEMEKKYLSYVGTINTLKEKRNQ